MKLRFIGKDGSMGLVHGSVYNCEISSAGNKVYIYWYRYNAGGRCYCPYSSLAKALENWEEVSNL